MATPVLYYRGFALYHAGRSDEAKKILELAHSQHTWHIHVLNLLAGINVNTNNNEKALELYNEALEISPDFEEALVNKTIVLLNLKRTEEAWQTINKLDKDSEYHNYLKVYDIARQAYEKSKGESPVIQ